MDPLAFKRSSVVLSGLLIDKEINQKGIFRVGLCLQAILSKLRTEEITSPHFSSRLVRVVESIDNADVDDSFERILRQRNVFRSVDSGWIPKKLSSLDVEKCHKISLAGLFLPANHSKT